MNRPRADEQADYRRVIYHSNMLPKNRFRTSGGLVPEYAISVSAILHRVREWLPSDRNTPVLDMGCGEGEFLYLLNKLGFTDLTGVDMNPEKVKMAREACPRATIIHGDVREILAKATGQFGLISGFDIIEHFRKDEVLSLLSLVCNALLGEGRLILQTPNANSPLVGSIAYGDFTHEWFYTPASLSDMLQLVGLGGYEARACGPYVHGVKSLSRSILWFMFTILFRIVDVAETGNGRKRIYTRAFLATAVKE